MLASTMQFSNNDPSPTYSTQRHLQRVRSTTENTSVPSGPNSAPDPTS